jgi:mono/diheme cytochrome c family protein
MGYRLVAALALACFLVAGALGWALADGHGRKEHHRERGREHGEELDDAVPAVTLQAYQDTCGACHFAFQPALLPAASWRAHLDGREDHFGNALDLDQSTLDELAAYLTANAADNAPGELASELRRGGGAAPLRVTELPEMRKEHHEIRSEVFARAAVGGRANCPACHPGAASGIYDDDSVRIPAP